MPISTASGPPIISSRRKRRLRLGPGCGVSTALSLMGFDPSGMLRLLHLWFVGRVSGHVAVGKVGAHPAQQRPELVALVLAEAVERGLARLGAEGLELVQQRVRPLSQEQQPRAAVA